MVLEFHRHLAFVHVDRDGSGRGIHQVTHRICDFPGQKVGDLEAAQEAPFAVSHEQEIKHLGQFATRSQVTQDYVQADVRADGDDIRVHQAAGRVFRIGQNLGQALPFLSIHAAQHFTDNRVRQVVENISEIIQVEVIDRRHQVFGRSTANQSGAHFVIYVHQDVTIELWIRHAPDDQSFCRWQRFEEITDLGGGQVLQQVTYLVLCTGIQCLGQVVEVTCGLVFTNFFCHDVLHARPGQQGHSSTARIIREYTA